jgi:hypothetical protein
MQVRYQLRHSPELLPLKELFFRYSPEQLKYLRTAIPKIPNRAYSAGLPAYSASVEAAAFAEASSPSCRSTTGQSFHRRSSA